MECLYVIIVAFAVLKTADSLYCWKCQSKDDGICADYFNETRIRRTPSYFASINTEVPSEENCETMLSLQITDQRAVCMKRIETIGGRKHYIRKCAFIHVDLPIADCLKEAHQDPRVQLDFCQQCDKDFCNAANIPKPTVYWPIFIPLISLLILKK